MRFRMMSLDEPAASSSASCRGPTSRSCRLKDVDGRDKPDHDVEGAWPHPVSFF